MQIHKNLPHMHRAPHKNLKYEDKISDIFAIVWAYIKQFSDMYYIIIVTILKIHEM